MNWSITIHVSKIKNRKLRRVAIIASLPFAIVGIWIHFAAYVVWAIPVGLFRVTRDLIWQAFSFWSKP